MKIYKIAVIPGDGVGPEVLTEGMKVLKHVAELDGTFRVDGVYMTPNIGGTASTSQVGDAIVEKFRR